VGEVGAVDLARFFPNISALSQASIEELQAIEGIGPNIAQGIVDWFATPTNQRVLEKLHLAGVWPQSESRLESTIPQMFTGLSFVITGTLPSLTREEAKALIEARGGKVTDSVSKKTGYLLLGTEPGSKYEKARTLGIQIIDETELLRMAG
jgi:DNA ligase (NAD+)